MDKIWDRKNPSKSEVIDRCGRDKKNNDHAELTKSRPLKKNHNKDKQFRITVYDLRIVTLFWIRITGNQ